MQSEVRRLIQRNSPRHTGVVGELCVCVCVCVGGVEGGWGWGGRRGHEELSSDYAVLKAWCVERVASQHT